MNLLENVKNVASRVKFEANKNSPHILLGLGIAAGVVTVGLAIKATPKAVSIVAQHEENIKTCNDLVGNEVIIADENGENVTSEYTQEDCDKDKLIFTVQTVKEMIINYGPTIAVGTLGIICVLASNRILNTRYAKLGVAYNTFIYAHKKYRERVANFIGEEDENALHSGVKLGRKEIKIKDENGKKHTVYETVYEGMDDIASPFTYYFDRNTVEWKNNQAVNVSTLKHAQSYFNSVLVAKKYVFLNDVLKYLGLPCSEIGQQAGWTYRPEVKTIDSFVDFGIFDKDGNILYWLTEDVNSIPLTFNVEGDILNTAFKLNDTGRYFTDSVYPELKEL